MTALHSIISPSRPKKNHSMDDLEFVVSSSEATEIACKLLCISSGIISAPIPRLGESVHRYSAHELSSSAHRSSEGSLFLVVHTTRKSRGAPGSSTVQVLSAEISLHLGKSGLLAEFDGLEYEHGPGRKQEAENALTIQRMEKESVYIGERVCSIEILNGDAVSNRAANLMETLVLPLLGDANDRLTDVVVRRIEDARERAVAYAESARRKQALEADRSSRMQRRNETEPVGFSAPVSIVDSTIRRLRVRPNTQS